MRSGNRGYWQRAAALTYRSWLDASRSAGTNVSAGLTVALVAIPLNLALAIACGLPPSVGLVTGCVAGILGAFLGASAYQITGPEVALAPITLAIVTEHGVDGLVTITMLAGALQIAFGVLRLGRIVHAIPVPVVGGFLAAVGLLVFDSQLPRLAGLPPDVRAVSEIRDPGVLLDVDPVVVAIGVVVVGVVVFLPRLNRRFPAPLVALAVAVTPVVVLGMQLPTVDAIAGGAFAVALPTMDYRVVPELLPSALALALLASTDSLLCAVSVDAQVGGERTRSDQELVAQGVANLVSAGFGGMPVAAAIVRSVAAIEAGATTRLAPLVQSIVLGLVVVVLGSFVSYVPLVALAGILLVVGARLVHVRQLVAMWRLARFEAVVFVVTAVGILVADFVMGVIVGTVAALAHFAHQQRRMLAHDAVGMHQTQGEDTSAVGMTGTPETVRLDGALFFGSQDRVAAVMSHGDADDVVLDLSGVTTIDTSGALALARAVSEMTERGVRVRVDDGGRDKPLLRWALTQEGALPDEQASALRASESPSRACDEPRTTPGKDEDAKEAMHGASV